MSSFDRRTDGCGDGFAPWVSGEVVSAPEPRSIFSELVEPGADRGAGIDGEDAAREAAAAAERAAELEAAFERGRAEGIRSVHDEFGDAATAFRDAVAALARTRQEMREQAERELLGVAVAVAEKILADELSQDPGRWLGMIHKAIGRTLDRDQIRIRVGRALYHFLEPRMADVRQLLHEVRELEVVEDAGLAATDCVIETRYGDLELGLGSQLQVLAEKLLEET